MLADDLSAGVTIDINAEFANLAGDIVGANFGTVRFDASGILDLVARAAPVDLDPVIGAVELLSGQIGGRVNLGLPGADVGGLVDQLTARLRGFGSVLPEIDVTDVGLDGLAARIGAVQGALGTGTLADLLALVPGVEFAGTAARAGGHLGALLQLLRVLAGLTATAALTTRLEERTASVASILDVGATAAAGAALGRLAADTGLVAAIRRANPNDAELVGRLGVQVVDFLDAVLGVGDRWAAGMAFGEAALVGLDLTAGAAGLEAARLALEGADLDAVAALVAEVRTALQPLLDVPLPDPTGTVGGVVDQALALIGQLTVAVRAWDAASVAAPVQRIADFALGPVDEIRRVLESVGTGAAGAIRAVRGIVDEVDLTPVANTVRAALQPVVDTLDAIEGAVGDAETVLNQVAGSITTGLRGVQTAVSAAAGRIEDALRAVHTALSTIDLAGLAERLGTALRSVAEALASAQLTPYFDGAIDVIDTSASVLDAVPFGLLPTDVQQEIIDVSRPIRELDLQPVEDALRAELGEIRGSLRAEALEAIEAAYADVVEFLTSLDPMPFLERIERETLGQLRTILGGIDPEALLAPAADALAQVRGLLVGVDLAATVIEPLQRLFQPVLDALDALDPAALLAPVVAEVDAARATLEGLLHVDDITEAVTAFRARAAEALTRLDPSALASVLTEQVTAELSRLPSGPPGGPFGSLLVTLAQASGLEATEGAVGDVIEWVSGSADGAVVVKGRLTATAQGLARVREGVRQLDPAPLAAAAQAQHRALSGAVASHPPTSALRLALEPLLAGVDPAAALAGLAENRRRYLIALEADAEIAVTLAASGRSEVYQAATGLRATLVPLDAVPARLRALLRAVGVVDADRPFREVIEQLIVVAGPGRLVPALTELAAAFRDELLAALDALLAPVLDGVATVQGVIDALDLRPIVDELTALHSQVRGEILQLTPEELLGDVIGAADDVIDRLRAFDPLAPVRDVLTTAKQTAEAVLESARPTVVFAPVVEIHAELVRTAGGLDVASLLGPVLEALDGIVVQLDEGFDRTGDALQRLQDALPSEVTSSDIGGSVGVEVGIG